VSRSQDVAELERFRADRGERLMRIALALTGDRHEAEDLLRTALERLLRHTGTDMESYLFWPGGSGGWDSHGRPPSPDGSGTGSSRLSAQGSM
jgi:hypothetical protein